jgi:hypothetical protein
MKPGMDMGMPPDDSGATEDPAEDAGMDMSNGYTIELTVKPDGSMTIGVEPIAEEQSEESGEAGGDAEDTQSVSSLGDAIRVIKDIVAHAGDISDMQGSQDAMSSGYGKGAA